MNNTGTVHKAFAFTRNTEHQMELVGELNGASYLNDSRSIHVKQTLQSITEIDAELVLIIGGKDERTDYTWLLHGDLRKIKTIVYLGADTEKLFRVFSKADCLFVKAESLQEALFVCLRVAREGQVVLFSPACPSYDVFDNYKNRGNLFRDLFNQLIG